MVFAPYIKRREGYPPLGNVFVYNIVEKASGREFIGVTKTNPRQHFLRMFGEARRGKGEGPCPQAFRSAASTSEFDVNILCTTERQKCRAVLSDYIIRRSPALNLLNDVKRCCIYTHIFVVRHVPTDELFVGSIETDKRRPPTEQETLETLQTLHAHPKSFVRFYRLLAAENPLPDRYNLWFESKSLVDPEIVSQKIVELTEKLHPKLNLSEDVSSSRVIPSGDTESTRAIPLESSRVVLAAAAPDALAPPVPRPGGGSERREHATVPRNAPPPGFAHVYRITHVESGKVYIGSTESSLLRRMQNHRTTFSTLGRLLRLEAATKFRFEVLQTLPEPAARVEEARLIKELSPELNGTDAVFQRPADGRRKNRTDPSDRFSHLKIKRAEIRNLTNSVRVMLYWDDEEGRERHGRMNFEKNRTTTEAEATSRARRNAFNLTTNVLENQVYNPKARKSGYTKGDGFAERRREISEMVARNTARDPVTGRITSL